MQDLNHPSVRPGGEWMLVVMLLVVLTILFGGGALVIRHMAANPPELALPVTTEPISP